MNSLPSTIALGLIALAAVIAGAIVTTSGSDASALWAIAGTSAGALGGAMIPARNVSTPPQSAVTLP